MKIKMTINAENLGDFNTAEDNDRYIDAVLAAVEAEYPEADVSVSLSDNVSGGNRYFASDDHSGEIAENLHYIANRVWSEAKY